MLLCDTVMVNDDDDTAGFAMLIGHWWADTWRSAAGSSNDTRADNKHGRTGLRGPAVFSSIASSETGRGDGFHGANKSERAQSRAT
jgi:hypothetical protein